ncbi:NAD(P)-binding protein [Clostridium sp. D2Q-11]|uniref:NAD(P)-binding protein n=1 Tax=Anaeromonas frigoriresistens TaxID=2683708 RepID=A0A942UVB5_9FIRM|nr:NAD(P)-binding protein [Anaeromonas frigoriresistens]MBS4538695.1 NAD(P)-binding protein [Anaeromonas frigoriresistens]
MIRVNEIKLDINESINELPKKIARALKVNENEIVDYSIYRESIDARRKGKLFFVYTVDVELKNEKNIRFKRNVSKTPDYSYKNVESGNKSLKYRPVIIGTGPSGLFAGLLLAQRGYKPILIERGKDVDGRSEDVERFWNKRELNTESNIQFGEGGAGTFSDGKLTSRSKDLRARKVVEELVISGAPKEIIYSHLPHVGTDILKEVVKDIRKRIEELGGEIKFNTKLTSIELNNESSVEGIIINNEETINTNALFLGIGHSARDTYEMLYKKGLKMESKPLSIGVRIEHPQIMIDKVQYEEFYDNPRLGAASYRLSHRASNGRGVYTFCMCPGGMVVAAASEENMVVTNGMSEHKRDKDNANSALLVQVSPEDYEDDNPLSGIKLQREIEKRAFEIGGKNYNAPIQLVKDFLDNKKTNKIEGVNPSYLPGVTYSNLWDCLPHYICTALKEGIIDMDKKLKEFGRGDAILTGVETRSSSPVRIIRDKESLQSINIEGIYPIGEGAGYAGGIISAAIDGIRAAEKIIENYKPFN